ncbi:uncharacterized protein LOC124260815 [Haliotis rubra]|uniref:uncharacterized protein LOC124260815 n=1 Tax=Haliotis rubra TaxID=36100 RepID=UPI001EE59AE1|nr:uncharacterized protein LOC124260815 [Haliotis rubra]
MAASMRRVCQTCFQRKLYRTLFKTNPSVVVPDKGYKRWVPKVDNLWYNQRLAAGPEVERHRSEWINWNYDAEIYAFGKRLGEEFEESTLRRALTHRSYIEKEEQRRQELGIDLDAAPLGLTDNQELAATGSESMGFHIHQGLSVVAMFIPTCLRRGVRYGKQQPMQALLRILPSLVQDVVDPLLAGSRLRFDLPELVRRYQLGEDSLFFVPVVRRMCVRRCALGRLGFLGQLRLPGKAFGATFCPGGHPLRHAYPDLRGGLRAAMQQRLLAVGGVGGDVAQSWGSQSCGCRRLGTFGGYTADLAGPPLPSGAALFPGAQQVIRGGCAAATSFKDSKALLEQPAGFAPQLRSGFLLRGAAYTRVCWLAWAARQGVGHLPLWRGPPDFTGIALLRAVMSGQRQSSFFVRDFVLPQLIEADIAELWTISNPMGLLEDMLSREGRPAPEPRLQWSSASQTVMSLYYVGIYSDGRLLGQSPGETLAIAEEMAARDALKNQLGLADSRSPLPLGSLADSLQIDFDRVNPSLADLTALEASSV